MVKGSLSLSVAPPTDRVYLNSQFKFGGVRSYSEHPSIKTCGCFQGVWVFGESAFGHPKAFTL